MGKMKNKNENIRQFYYVTNQQIIRLAHTNKKNSEQKQQQKNIHSRSFRILFFDILNAFSNGVRIFLFFLIFFNFSFADDFSG